MPVEIRTEDAIRAFEKAGFIRRGRKPGSHEVLVKKGHPVNLSVRHDTMRIGLLRTLIRRAGLTEGEFLQLLRGK